MTRSNLARYGIVAAIAFVVALAALWLGQNFRAGHEEKTPLHALLHGELDLDSQQKRSIDSLEASFAVRQGQLDAEMRAANAELAEAIEKEHGYGPEVEKAVDRSHAAMGELQKATLQHLFAMRSVLRPSQRGAFDRAVAQALTGSGQT